MNMNNLFIVSTVYQLFNAINIKLNSFSQTRSDLIILDINNKTNYIAKKAKDSFLFENIKIIDIGFNEYTKKIKYILNRVMAKKKIFKQLEYKKYGDIFITGTEIFSKIIYAFYKKNNYTLNLNFLEDGVGSYNWVLTKDSKYRNIIATLISGNNVYIDCKKMYVYYPEIVKSIYGNINLVNLNKIDKSNSNIIYNKMKTIFSTKTNPENVNNIFIESNFSQKKITEDQFKIITLINNQLSHKDFVIKLHPSTLIEKYNKYDNIISETTSFEINNLYNDYNNKRIFTIISTCCLIPKLIYNEEPEVILLYNLVNLNAKKMELIKDMLTSMYSDKSKILCPKNKNELKDILEGLKKNVNE